ncbi:MAG: queuosine precursor transporter [Cytophagales bacterium]|nr:queuosine precursor transporter [Cytophagales bacterium]
MNTKEKTIVEPTNNILENDKAVSKSEGAFMVLASIFITCVVLSNVIAGKFFIFLGLPLSCAVIIYPITFLITDIISEIYGPKRAKILVLSGFGVSILITILVWIANKVPIANDSPVDEKSFNQIFGLLPLIMFSAMIAYLTAQFVDIQAFEFWRKLSHKRYLWLRNNASTLLSQLVDTVVGMTIAMVIWPMVDGNEHTQPVGIQLWIQIVLGQYSFKAVLALLDTPFVYAGVHLTKKWIGLQSN